MERGRLSLRKQRAGLGRFGGAGGQQIPPPPLRSASE